MWEVNHVNPNQTNALIYLGKNNSSDNTFKLYKNADRKIVEIELHA